MSLVAELFTNLPCLEYIYLGFHKDAGGLEVYLDVCEKHVKHFSRVLPNGATFHELKDEVSPWNISMINSSKIQTTTSYRAVFGLSLGSPYSFHYLRRFFQSTNHIRLLGLQNFTKEMMEPVIEIMRAVEIRHISILGKCDQDSRYVITSK